ncbi:hypothetical protein BV22DRAFT_1134883 [Leucogyrophana mollusca]|uniref:Uncharacterized protein n=1 Tax=Leucogyrophana mollusca TaxID=85980 RepID=A0ACB8AZR0_9AGAM|nr:hypothetical protein BV22DRAFT_1134883 [Leucogyrophana mollusca]
MEARVIFTSAPLISPTPESGINVLFPPTITQIPAIRHLSTNEAYTTAFSAITLSPSCTPLSLIDAYPVNAGEQTVRYSNVAGLAVLIFDYCITLGSEIHWVWGKPWDIARTMFTCTRYMTFAGTVMTVYAAVASREGENCSRFSSASNAIHIISIVTAEGLLILRTYAFWGRSKKLLIALLIFAPGCIVGAVTMPSFVKIPALPDTELEDTPVGVENSCIFQTFRGSALQYVWLVVFELVLLALTVIKRFRHYRYTTSPLITVLYRDGINYMVCIILVSTINIFVTLFVPPAYNEIMDSCVLFISASHTQWGLTAHNVRLQLALHSLLASRILFNLRESYQRPPEQVLPVDVLVFRSSRVTHRSFESSSVESGE